MAKDGPLHGSGWALSSREPQNDDEQVQSMQTAASRSLERAAQLGGLLGKASARVTFMRQGAA